MRDAFNRRLPPLAYKNSIDRIFGVVDAPTDNIAWFDAIGERLARATAEMKAEQERKAFAQRAALTEFTDNYGLGISHD